MDSRLERTTRAGLWTLGAAGAVWAWGSLAGGDRVEAFWCATVMGIALASIAHRPALLAGAALPAMGSTHWLADAIRAGDPGSVWVLFGIGIDAAALLLVGAAYGLWQGRLALRLAFGLVALAGIRMLAADHAPSLWLLATLFTIAGGALLAWRPPRFG